MSTTGEQTAHYCKRHGIFCTGANERGECNTTACWNSTARTAEQEGIVMMMSDYIKREDARKWLANLKEDCGRHQDLWHYGEALEQIIESLDADVAPVRHGHWLYTAAWPHRVYCSACFRTYALKHWQVWEDGSLGRAYCPHCGAKMDGGDD